MTSRDFQVLSVLSFARISIPRSICWSCIRQVVSRPSQSKSMPWKWTDQNRLFIQQIFYYTTRLTWVSMSTEPLGTICSTHLEESFQPPDLKYCFSYQNAQLKHWPPFNSCVCALCCISMCSFSYNDVCLFVFHLGQDIGKFAHYHCQSRSLHLPVSLPSASKGSDGLSDSGT